MRLSYSLGFMFIGAGQGMEPPTMPSVRHISTGYVEIGLPGQSNRLQTLWLAKGTPRSWSEDGQIAAVTSAPTRHGLVSFNLHSHVRAGRIDATVDLPSQREPRAIRLRLRLPESHKIQKVTLDGKPWLQFDRLEETITLPEHARGRLRLTVDCPERP